MESNSQTKDTYNDLISWARNIGTLGGVVSTLSEFSLEAIDAHGLDLGIMITDYANMISGVLDEAGLDLETFFDVGGVPDWNSLPSRLRRERDWFQDTTIPYTNDSLERLDEGIIEIEKFQETAIAIEELDKEFTALRRLVIKSIQGRGQKRAPAVGEDSAEAPNTDQGETLTAVTG